MSFLLCWLELPFSPTLPHFFSSGMHRAQAYPASFASPRTVLTRQKCCSGLPSPPQEVLPSQGSSCVSCLLHWQADSFWSQLIFSDLCFLPNLLAVMSVSSSIVLIIAHYQRCYTCQFSGFFLIRVCDLFEDTAMSKVIFKSLII